MHRRFTALSLTLFLVLCASTSRADVSGPIVINPHDDGHIRSNGVWGNSSYLTVAAGATYDIRGIAEFALASVTGDATISSATLSINPYGLPIWGLGIDVYGYQSNDGAVAPSDYNAGAFIGHWDVPDTLNFGQDTFFDVTSFLQTVSSPYAGFNLRTPDGGYQMSSLEYNYGHPAQLSVIVPEPAGVYILAIAAAALTRRRRAPGPR